MKPLYLVDISSFIFRAFYAIRPLTSPKGEPTNAVYGVASMLYKLIEDEKPESLIAVFDSKEPSFRKTTYAEYKANRSAPPDDLLPQFDRIEALVRAMGIPMLRESGVEADDLIASAARKWLRDSKADVCIVSGDKDLLQLVGSRVTALDTMKGVRYSSGEVREKMGVPPEQVRDYLALVGDSSDNIPGVPSIGPKSAVQLLEEFGSLEGVLAAARDGKITGKKGDTLRENVKAARLSWDLVGLKEDCEVGVSPSEVAYQFRVDETLSKLFVELGFQKLLDRWKQIAGGTNSTAAAPTQASLGPALTIPDASPGGWAPSKLTCIDTEAKLAAILQRLERSPEFAVDLETTSLNPRASEIVGVALAFDEQEGFYIPVGHREAQPLDRRATLAKLKPILENPKLKKIGQNLKFDFEQLVEHGIHPKGLGADTMIASYILDPTGRHNLDTLSQRYLGYTPMSFEAVCGKGKDQITFDQVPIDQATRYSAEDAVCAMALWRKMKPELERAGLMPAYAELELPLVPVLVDMELEGVRVDREYLAGLSAEFQKEIDVIETKIKKFTNEPLNLNSPKQLGKFLFEDLKLPVMSKTKTGPSTDASVLEKLSGLHEAPRLILEYREIAKLKGTYIDPIPELIDPKTGRVHGSFHQTGTATGRLSSSDPNLQNIPIRSERGQRIRRAFVPRDGWVLVSADYSQIELRILAHLSEDADLTASFVKDEDVHRRTASELFEVDLARVTDEQRAIAKAINFGLMYGKTAFGLAEELGIPRGEAKAIIDRYFTRYATVKRFLDGLIEQARETQMAYTLLGRRRPLPEIHAKNPMVRANAERMAMNTPIQGTAADLVKLAMVACADQIHAQGLSAKLIIQVHDELVFECPKSEIAPLEKLVREAMEGALKLKVPLRVNIGSGANWMEC